MWSLIKSTSIVKQVDGLLFMENKAQLLKSYTPVLFSGSVDEWFYKRLFPNRTFLKVDNAMNAGQVFHYAGKAYTKNQLKKGQIPELDPNDMVITYKDYKHLFQNSHPTIHFGSVEGFNTLIGKNLSIVGTPVPNPRVTQLYAHVLGYETNNQAKCFRSICINQSVVEMYTFKDEVLAQIEIRIARMQLLQAIGRARTVLENCRVTVYTRVPIGEVADIVQKSAI
jgi:hypothetical protein